MTLEDKAPTVFRKEFTQQEPLPQEAVSRVMELLENGRLHRYNTSPGQASDVSLLEQEFAEYLGVKYAAAFSSCGSSLYVALKCAGVKPGDKVLCNAFTLAPVPGAIENAGADVVLVEIQADYTISLDDLAAKAESSGAKYLLLSHMRGHMADMDRIVEICQRHGLDLIEDCAHTLGAHWNGRPSGTFGRIGCFSTQTYKHMNSGEGGLLATDDEDLAAQAILYSGSYMLYDRHLSRPPLEVFERHRYHTPNFSLRMSNLAAALLRPQLKTLDAQCARWNERYRLLEELLGGVDHIVVPSRDSKEDYVGSSIQFTLQGLDRAQIARFLATTAERGVEIKWFGREEPHGFTSAYTHWKYIRSDMQLPTSNQVLGCLCDFRIPLTFTLEDCRQIAAVIREVMVEIA